jgi:hypothetical protein
MLYQAYLCNQAVLQPNRKSQPICRLTAPAHFSKTGDKNSLVAAIFLKPKAAAFVKMKDSPYTNIKSTMNNK